MIFTTRGTDKYFQRYLASNASKIGFLKLWPGEEAGSNSLCDVIVGTGIDLQGTRRNAVYKNNTKI